MFLSFWNVDILPQIIVRILDLKLVYMPVINELKINMTPGSAMGMKDYGYFRVCFAKEDAQIDEFIRRLSSQSL